MLKQVILVICIAIVLTGCGSTKDTLKKISKQDQAFADDFKTVKENPVGEDMAYLLYLNSLNEDEPMTPTPNTPLPEMTEDELMEKFLGVKTDWPAEFLSLDMPEYTAGKINGWNTWGDSKYDLFILIDNTSQKDLDAYIEALKANGFTEEGDRFIKDLFYVEFQFNATSILQISSNKEDLVEWPDDFLGFMPPVTEGYLVTVSPPSDEEPYGDLYFIDLTEDEILTWESTLEDKGFTIDYGSYSKSDVTLNGKKYKHLSAFFESNGGNDQILYFSFDND